MFKPTSTFNFKMLCSLALWLLPTLVFASGGIGGVSAVPEENGFKVSWNWNMNNYQPGSSADFIRVCYKKRNTARRICKSSSLESAAPAQISGLKDGTKYKIKVECYCKKKKRKNKWKKAKWRKVGTLVQSTLTKQVNPDNYSGNISIIKTTPSILDVRFTAGNTTGANLVRVCYRKGTALNNLKSQCRKRHNVWTGKNGKRLGYIERSSGGSFDHSFTGLRDGTDYKFAVAVFATGHDAGKVVDVAKGRTPKIKKLIIKSAPGGKAGNLKPAVLDGQATSLKAQPTTMLPSKRATTLQSRKSQAIQPRKPVALEPK